MDEDISVRQENAGDAEAIDVVNRSAFGGEAEAVLVQRLRSSPNFVPELSLVAEVGGRIVGHVMLFRTRLSRPQGHLDVLALAPMSVVPSRSHRGIGSALVRAATAKAASLGYGAIIVVGHPEYYGRFGFQRLSARGIRCPLPVPEEAVTGLELVPGALSGGGVLSYPSAFAELFRQDPALLAAQKEF